MGAEQVFLWIGTGLILAVLLLEFIKPKFLQEGFSDLVPYDTSYFGQFIPKRGDVGPGSEEGGYIRDVRYFNGYANVQRLGAKNDFCRMVKSKTNPNVLFFACALAGMENMSSTDFRTPTTKDGLKVSRDDYMRDVDGDGREDYCRILKMKEGTYRAVCNRAKDDSFDERLIIDMNPPQQIDTLLTFYEGCIFWYRFRDDMLDYVNNTQLMRIGGISIDEKPNPTPTYGLNFNGIDQAVRIGDNADLELGAVVHLRGLRALSFWVYFERFTNNAHIIDFGNGAGNDNMFVGIIGRGDSSISEGAIRSDKCGEEGDTVPIGPSGPQNVREMSPQKLMESTAANVNEYDSFGFEMNPRKLPPSRINDKPLKGIQTGKATLIYEIWDQKQRRMRITLGGVIKLKTWTHIAITAVEMDSLRPTIQVYINGELSITKPSGFLPQPAVTTNNYFGKSNWLATTNEFENKDEIFQGSLFDVRGYKTPMSAKKIGDTVKWGKEMLGLE
jgi:hypothetical protein